MNDQERKSPSALVSALAAARTTSAAAAAAGCSILESPNNSNNAASSDGDATGSGAGASASAFRELAGSPTSMRSAALARLAATSGALNGTDSSLDHLHLLLAQRSQQQQQDSMMSEGLHHQGFPPHVAALLAQQRLKLLQEQATDRGGAGAANAGGAVPPSGMSHLSTLGLLQQRQSELLLAEQIRLHHGRLLASQLAHNHNSDELSGGPPAAPSSTLGLNHNNDGSHGVTRSNSTASARSSSLGASGRNNGAAKLDGSGVGGADDGRGGDAGDVGAADDNEDGDNDNKETDDSLDTFPFKLFRMLEEAEAGDDRDIVSFNDKGRCFMIHKPREFVAEIMPKYFTTTRMSSFQRQLNLYGFRRIPEGPDKGGYVHESFVRGQKNLCRKIKRKKPNSKVPPSGLMYVNPSSLPGSLMQGNLPASLSVRQILADGQRSSDQVAAAHQLAQLGGLGGLVGMYGVGNSTLSAALLLEQQQQQHLRLRLQQQQLQQHQQADIMQHLLMRQQQERDLVQLLHRHQQDAQQQQQQQQQQGIPDAQVLGGQQGPR